MLYEDMEYQRGFLSQETTTDKRKFEYHTEDSIRPKKQKGAIKAVELGETDDSKLDEKQMKRIHDFGKNTMSNCATDISHLSADINELGQYIAPVVKSSLEELRELYKCRKAIFDEVVETESSGDFVGFMKTLLNLENRINFKKAR